MLIKEAYDQGLLDDFMYDLLPKECDYCGSPIEVTDNLTFIWCSNSICPEHLAAKIEIMIKEFSIDGFGRKLCRDLVEENYLTFPSQVFSLEAHEMPSHYTPEMQETLYDRIQGSRTQPLWRIVKALQYDGFSERAKKVFGGYSDIKKFYLDLEQGGEAMVAELLNMNFTPTTERIYELLWDNFEEIVQVTSMFNIPVVASKTIKVAMTGGITSLQDSNGNKYANRELFLADMTQRYADKINILGAARPTGDCNYFISDSKSSSSKYKQAEANNIAIMTALEFKEMLEEL